ncbi:MAG: FAD-dependent oxidoreductase [Bryobacterales bacterium]|nr:FAD-dependent oxidoreductase [Bryobacterales bacterium]
MIRLAFACTISALAVAGAEPGSFDVVIAGGTASGTAAAITAARQGLKVALVERTNRIGGMAVNGISNTDCKIREASSGIFEEFRRQVKAHYGNDPAASDGFRFEPKVALAVFRAMVAGQPGISVLLDTRPVEVIRAAPNRAAGIVAESRDGSRRRLEAQVVIDATDEADVAVWAGAQYRAGREARSPEEPHAGIIYLDRGGIIPRDTSVPHRYALLPGSTGAADRRIQGYSYLMIVKDYGAGPASRPHVLTTPPPGYDPEHYKHVSPWEKSWAMQNPLGLPGRKREINQYPFGVELPGGNTDYLEGSAEVRSAILERHRNHALGYLYYLQHVEGKLTIGLADDEFEDSGNFPPQIYVRQGRRIIGEHILNETDINPLLHPGGERTPLVRDAIAVGSFPIDVHPVQPKPDPRSPDNGEGELFLPETTAPFQVPYRCLVPLGVEGLLVSQAISSTHIGYQGVRLEMIRMSMGMAAGHAAALSIRTGRPLRSIDVGVLQDRLIESGSILYLFRDVLPGSPFFRSVQKLALANAVSGFEDYRFRPDDPLTRSQLAEMLVRAFEIPVSVTATHFQDVPKGHPAYRYVETLFDRDIAGPLVGKEAVLFGPDTPVTEGQLEQTLALLAGSAAPEPPRQNIVSRGQAAVRIAREVWRP